MDKRKALLVALDHLNKGAWQAAHAIVQNDESQTACWTHGIVHLLEGDTDNARYWYRRAERVMCWSERSSAMRHVRAEGERMPMQNL